MFDNKTWEVLNNDITINNFNLKRFNGFSFINSSHQFVYDIGDEVYFVIDSTVYKGKILSINFAGLCKLSYLPDNNCDIFVKHYLLYDSAYIAIKEAEYNNVHFGVHHV